MLYKRIFIVEDDPTSESILNSLIHSIDSSARIEWEENGERALKRVAKEREEGRDYDLIIADIFLSGKTTGIELWQACRSQFPDTPILITSSLPPDRYQETIGNDPIAPTYLPKPFRINECKKILEVMLS